MNHAQHSAESQADTDLGVAQALEGYLERLEAGEPPDPHRLLAEHPEIAGKLRACLDVIALGQRGRGDPPAVAEMAGEPAPGAEAPRLIGDYELLDELGRGGMGVVFRARDRKLGRAVALKMVLADAWASPEHRRRFRAEAEAAAALDHPQIVPIYETGEHGGASYYTMRLLEGGSLANRLAAFGDEPRAAARLVVIVAHAVRHAHERGVLHRDLKPSNILLDARGEPYVGDFGLAKRVGEPGERTATGAVLGTPAYMAPELASGRREAATTAADVYGLGVVLYCLLAGRPPFAGDSALDVLDRVRAEAPPSPRDLNRRVDGDLDAVCLKCLEKEPGHRYASAAALAEDLERWLAGRPTLARPVGRRGRAWRWAKRHRRGLAAAAISLLLMAGLAAGIDAAARDRGARRAAAQSTAELRRRAREARQYRYVADIRLAARHLHEGQMPAFFEVLDRQRPGPDEEDVRSFAWYRLLRLGHAEERTLRGHRGPVYHAEFSRDGRVVATSGQDGTVRLWDPATGEALRVIHAHDCDVNWVAIAPDGGTLATTGDDGTVRLWAAAGRRLGTLTAHRGPAVIALFSPDGRTLITCGRHDGTVKAWDVATQQERDSFQANRDPIEGMALAPNGQVVATAAHDRLTRLWDWKRHAEPITLEGHSGAVNAVAFSHDGTRVVTGSGDRTIAIWDARTGRRLKRIEGHGDAAESVAFSPDDGSVASGAKDTTIRIWNGADGTPRSTLVGHRERVWGVGYSPDGRMLVSASDDGTAKLWVLGAVPARRDYPGFDPVGAGCAPDGRGLLVLDGDGVVRSWEIDSGRTREVVRLPAPVAGLYSARFSADGRKLAVADGDHVVSLWRLPAGERAGTFRWSSSVAGHLGFAPGDQFLTFSEPTAANLRDGFVWDTEAGGAPERIDGVEFATFAPDGDAIVRIDQDRLGRWDRRTRRVSISVPFHIDYAHCLAVSPDGSVVAFGSKREAALFDARTLQPLGNLGGRSAEANAVAFSPDSQVLASGHGDGTVRLWDVATREELLTIDGRPDGVIVLSFSPDGRSLAVQCRGTDNLRHVWLLTTARPEEFDPPAPRQQALAK